MRLYALEIAGIDGAQSTLNGMMCARQLLESAGSYAFLDDEDLMLPDIVP